MDEPNRDVAPARRHIIKRPRLTRLLNETSARIILLVAPAGYGKTTLAREWLEERDQPYAWYQSVSASADPAALSVGVADVLTSIAREAQGSLEARLRVRENPPHAATLAELITGSIKEWPDDFLLVIDDYHLIARDESSEDFIRALVEGATPRLLITTRRRPSWVTSRDILYGNVTELGRDLLALNRAEGAEVLARVQDDATPGFLALARGWPAVVGLAALSGRVSLREGELPQPLYDYMAHELYQAASKRTRQYLPLLALSKRPTRQFLLSIAGQHAAAVLTEVETLGLAAADGNDLGLHPLFLRFLRTRLARLPSSEVARSGVAATRTLLDHGGPEEAFDVAASLALPSLMLEVLERSFEAVLLEGRLTTLQQWVDQSRRLTQHPLLDLVDAEVAFWRGEYDRAQALIDRSIRNLPANHPRGARALLRGGYCAYFREDEGAALTYFERARTAARTGDETVEALWGQFLCVILSELPSARSILQELEQTRPEAVDDHAVRVAQGRLELANRSGGLDLALGAALKARHLLPFLDSPMRRTGFMSCLATGLLATGRYTEALAVTDDELEEATRFGLIFALPHALTLRAGALLGLGRMREARVELDRAMATLRATDAHTEANVACLRTRLDLALGDAAAAMERIKVSPPAPIGIGMLGEYLATRALAFAAAGEGEKAVSAATEAERTTQYSETLVLAEAARTIASINRGDLTVSSVQGLLSRVRATQNVDALIAACRTHPPLLRVVFDAEASLSNVLTATPYDQRLATKQGLRPPPSDSSDVLSPREQEVLKLVADGLRNKEIAQALFISEVTVKVHVRHILRKLNLRSRTEAAVFLQRQQGDASDL